MPTPFLKAPDPVVEAVGAVVEVVPVSVMNGLLEDVVEVIMEVEILLPVWAALLWAEGLLDKEVTFADKDEGRLPLRLAEICVVGGCDDAVEITFGEVVLAVISATASPTSKLHRPTSRRPRNIVEFGSGLEVVRLDQRIIERENCRMEMDESQYLWVRKEQIHNAENNQGVGGLTWPRWKWSYFGARASAQILQGSLRWGQGHSRSLVMIAAPCYA